MDLYLNAFSFPRGGPSPPPGTVPSAPTRGAVGSALSPDARVVGSRPTPATSPPAYAEDARSPSSAVQARRAQMHTDAVNEVCARVMAAHPCHAAAHAGDTDTSSDAGGPPQATAAPVLSHGLPRFSITLYGTQAQVAEARGELLQTLPRPWTLRLRLPWAELVDGLPTDTPTAPLPLQPEVRERFEQIMQQSATSLSVAPLPLQWVDAAAELADARHVLLTIAGSVESIEYARVQVLLFLDERQGFVVDHLDLQLKEAHVGAGRKRAAIESIERETGACVYMPSPFAGALQSQAPPLVLQRRGTVYVSGTAAQVSRARELVQRHLAPDKALVTRQVSLMPHKLDWLLQERLEALRGLMYDNGTFLELPVLGSQQTHVVVHGAARVDVERSVRMLMQLVAPYYTAHVWLLPGALDTLQIAAPKSEPRQLVALMAAVTAVSGVDATFHNSALELHGTDAEVRAGLQYLMRQSAVKHYIGELRFQLELATEHREFISGKKNGKINKIMESCGVRIRFEPFNDYNFLIDVHGRDADAALQGLGQLQEELPAEMSFHVPESYHKRIIGVGGKNIQRIMKKFGVYVKFSNAEEFAALGGYIDNNDNVIARTPSKNASNLENLKHSVMELVSPKDKDFVTDTVAVPRAHHRRLRHDHAQTLEELEHRTRSTIRFPPQEAAQDDIHVSGPESQTALMIPALLQHVPVYAEWTLPLTYALTQLLDSSEFAALCERVHTDCHVSLRAQPRPRHARSACVFTFEAPRAHAELLARAKDALLELCTAHHVSPRPSVDTALATSSAAPQEPFAATAMPPFSTSRFSPSKADSELIAGARFDEAPATGTPAPSSAPSSGPKDLKALFEQSDATAAMPFESASANTPLLSPFYTPGYTDNASLSAQVWGAPLSSLPDRSSHTATSASVFSPFASNSMPFAFGAGANDPAMPSEASRASVGAFSSGALRRSDPMAGLAPGVDRNATPFAPHSHSLSRSPMALRGMPERSADMDGFPPLGDTSSLGSTMMGPPGCSPSRPRAGMHIPQPPRSSVQAGGGSDTMDEVSRVLAQIAFEQS